MPQAPKRANRFQKTQQLTFLILGFFAKYEELIEFIIREAISGYSDHFPNQEQASFPYP